MNKYLKIKSPWSQLAIFFIMLAGGIVMIGLISAAIYPGHKSLADAPLGVAKLLQALSSVVVFLVPAILFSWITYREQPLHFLGFRPSYKSEFYILAIAIFLCCFPFEGWLGQLNKALPMPQWMHTMERENEKQIEAFLKTQGPADMLINLIVMALLPAICEEALFRGVFQQIMIRAFRSPWLGILISAAFFSAFHLQFEGFFPRLFLGLLLGAVFWLSDSLWVAILAHFFTNGIQVVAVYYYPSMVSENPSVPVYAALLSIVLVVGLLWTMRKRSEVSYAAVYGPMDNTMDNNI